LEPHGTGASFKAADYIVVEPRGKDSGEKINCRGVRYGVGRADERRRGWTARGPQRDARVKRSPTGKR
jgi:hypothetical protein